MSSEEPGRDTTDGPADAAPSAVSRARRIAGRSAGAGPRPVPQPSNPRSSRRPRPSAKAQPPGTATAAPDAPAAQQPVDADPEPESDATVAQGAPAQRSRAGRNLPAAIGVGAGLGALVVASLFVYRPSFAVLVGIAVLYGCYELAQALKSGGIRVSLVPILVGGAATLIAAWERGTSGLVLATLITIVGLLVWRVADGAHGYARDVSASALTVLYLPALAGFAVLLAHPSDGAGRVLAFVATVVCSDTGGYATGVLFGRHPLAPIISKGKTWEGFAGSVLACSGAGILFLTLTFHQTWWKGLLFGLAMVATATVGDLGASMMKRDIGIKDWGSLLPGHGGLIDRLDSLLPCAAVAYLILSGV